MNTFIKKIWQLVYRPTFFIEQNFTKERYIRFYSRLILIFSLSVFVLMIPSGVSFWRGVVADDWFGQRVIIEKLFPDMLEVTVEKGMISTNVQEPYAIALPEQWQSMNVRAPKNILVIDTITPITQERFSELDTIFILGQHAIGQYDTAKQRVSITDIRETSALWSGFIDRAKYSEFVHTGFTVLLWVALVMSILLPFFLYFIFWIGYLAYLVFGACVVWLGARVRGQTLSYQCAFLAGIYLLPIPLLYPLILSITGIGMTPFLFSVILFGATLLNFKQPVISISRPEEATESKIDIVP